MISNNVFWLNHRVSLEIWEHVLEVMRSHPVLSGSLRRSLRQLSCGASLAALRRGAGSGGPPRGARLWQSLLLALRSILRACTSSAWSLCGSH